MEYSSPKCADLGSNHFILAGSSWGTRASTNATAGRRAARPEGPTKGRMISVQLVSAVLHHADLPGLEHLAATLFCAPLLAIAWY